MGVSGQFSQCPDRYRNRVDLVAGLFQQRPYQAFGPGDSAGDDAEEAGEYVLWRLPFHARVR